MFTIEQREAVRDRVIALAHEDPRIVGGAVVGSLALGDGDRFSDLDLTFAVADGVPVMDVLDDFTRSLRADLAAVVLVDLQQGDRIYRVFLLPNALQFDLSLSHASQFIPAGPRFRLLFGETSGPPMKSSPPEAANLFGWGVIYALHARACIERGRPWQAEHYIGAVRDHALSLACLRQGLIAVQARGYDDLPADILARFGQTHIGSHEKETLRKALAGVTRGLVSEAKEAKVSGVESVAHQLAEIL